MVSGFGSGFRIPEICCPFFLKTGSHERLNTGVPSAPVIGVLPLLVLLAGVFLSMLMLRLGSEGSFALLDISTYPLSGSILTGGFRIRVLCMIYGRRMKFWAVATYGMCPGSYLG